MTTTSTASKFLLGSRSKDHEALVVLYELPLNKATPWVTWLARKDAPDATFWGHYFARYKDALEDFDNR